MGDELDDEVILAGTMILTVTVLFESCVIVVVGPPIVAVLIIVVVTVAAGPFNPGVNPDITPGVLVRLVGGTGGGAGNVEAATEVELQPSDIGIGDIIAELFEDRADDAAGMFGPLVT